MCPGDVMQIVNGKVLCKTEEVLGRSRKRETEEMVEWGKESKE